MNLLVDILPLSLTIGDVEYPIRSDFRDCLRIILAFEDVTLTAYEKQIILLANLFLEPPINVQEALQQAHWFLNGGKEAEKDSDAPRLYSFSRDANLIFAAFRQTHGIDLQKDNLHWWSFMALFMDLGQDTTFCQLVSLRKRVKTGKASKEELHAAREMGEIFDVPEFGTRTIEELEEDAERDKAEREFLRLVEQGKQKQVNNG